MDSCVSGRALTGPKKIQMENNVANVSFPQAARLRKEAYRARDSPALGHEQSSSERKEKAGNTEL